MLNLFNIRADDRRTLNSQSQILNIENNYTTKIKIIRKTIDKRALTNQNRGPIVRAFHSGDKIKTFISTRLRLRMQTY